jgi:DnaB-like helicase N terminal domain/AAA domain
MKKEYKITARGNDFFDEIKKKVRKENGDMSQFLFGRPMPQNIEIEQYVLGAILCDSSAMETVQSLIRTADYFYNAKHQAVYEKALHLYNESKPINIITVSDAFMKEKKAKSSVTPHDIIELTNRVGSVANLEYYARLLFEYHAARFLITKSLETITQLFEGDDVLATYENLVSTIRLDNPVDYFRVRSMNQVILDATKEANVLRFASSFLFSNDLAFCFAPPGVGKSIFAIQIAEAVAQGVSVLRTPEKDILLNEAPPIKVLFFDFELRDKEIEMRYSDTDAPSNKYVFSDNFYRVDGNPLFESVPDGTDIAKFIIRKLEDIIIKEEPKLVIIDNITRLAGENISDPAVARRIMERLDGIRKKHSISMLVVAHTTKQYNKATAIEESSMGGAAAFANFATTLWGLGRSTVDNNEFYLKQLKVRNGIKEYESDNVIVLRKTKRDNNFLCFTFERFDEESNLILAQLSLFGQPTTTQEDIYEEAIRLKIACPEKTWGQIALDLNWTKKQDYLRQKCVQYVTENDTEYIYVEKDKRFYRINRITHDLPIDADKIFETLTPEQAAQAEEFLNQEKN